MKMEHVGLFLLASMLFFSLACKTPAGRSPGEVVDDSTITTKVKSKLLVRKEISLCPINVATCEGAVTLTGIVASPGQRNKAGQIARSVVGVKKVNNLLQVKKGYLDATLSRSAPVRGHAYPKRVKEPSLRTLDNSNF